jgi:putative resolvase
MFVVEHRDRLSCFARSSWEFALAAARRRVPVAGPGETADDLGREMSEVRKMSEVRASMCVRLYGRRGVGTVPC